MGFRSREAAVHIEKSSCQSEEQAGFSKMRNAVNVFALLLLAPKQHAAFNGLNPRGFLNGRSTHTGCQSLALDEIKGLKGHLSVSGLGSLLMQTPPGEPGQKRSAIRRFLRWIFRSRRQHDNKKIREVELLKQDLLDCRERLGPNHQDTLIILNKYAEQAGLFIAERPKVLQALPLPEGYAHHMTLTTPGRIIVVGDPHGCFDEFEELLRECAFNASAGDAVVIAGDLVNKGPKSLEMLRAARDREGVWSVRGNHEDGALWSWQDWKEGRTPRHAWVRNMSETDVSYLQRLPYTCALPQYNALVVHAGLVMGRDVDSQGAGDMVRMRNVALVKGDWHRPEWVALERDDVGVPWAEFWSGPPHVFFGHDAKRQLQLREHATGLDTGCVYGFQLTACILDPEKPGERRLVHIPARAQYTKPG